MHKEFGYFDDENNEYVITTPLTPRPWENRIWNKDINLQISNHGTGITYKKDHKGRFVLYNYSGHRYLYIYDKEKGILWSPAWFPVNRNLDYYQGRHGLNYTVITGELEGIQVSWKVTVHPQESAELWHLEIKNKGKKKAQLLLVPYFQLDISFKDPYFGPVNLFRARVSEERHCLYIKNHSYRRDAEDYAVCLHSNKKIEKYELSKEAFLKGYSSFSFPKTVVEDDFENLDFAKSTSTSAVGNDLGADPESVGSTPAFALGYDLALGPEKKETIQIELFSEENFGAALKKRRIFAAQDSWHLAVVRHKEAASEWIHTNTLKTNDSDFDRYVNVWIKHQLRYTSQWVLGWNIGFRDSMQDADIYRIFDTSFVRKRILEASRHIYQDGHTVRCWAGLDTKLYYDGGVWYVNTIVDYLRESGDFQILEEVCPFLDGGKSSVLDHMKKTMDFLDKQRGPSGICRMGFGDWNDALNGVDREGKGESVWTSMAFIWSLRSLIELLHRIRDDEEERYRTIARELSGLLNEKFFEGDRYIRAVTDNGEKIGSHTSKEGKIYLNPQSWAIICGVANKERTKSILAQVRKSLYTDFGPILLSPPYTTYNESMGRITGDAPGVVENGANYVHASMFYAYALTLCNLTDEAFDILKCVLPTNPKNPPEISGLEPFSLTNSYEGPASKRPGRAMFSWRTGSAGWFLKVVWDGMIGILPHFDDVKINAKLPLQWGDRIEVSRIIRGKKVFFDFVRSPVRCDDYDLVIYNHTILDYTQMDKVRKILVIL